MPDASATSSRHQAEVGRKEEEGHFRLLAPRLRDILWVADAAELCQPADAAVRNGILGSEIERPFTSSMLARKVREVLDQ
jgi:hypothetical protein